MVKGNIVDLIIPFKEDKQIDYDEFEKILAYQKDYIDGILFSKNITQLDNEEKLQIVKFVLKKLNNIKIIVDISNFNPKEVVLEASKYNDLNIDSFLVNALDSNEEGLIKYYRYIADRINHHIVINNTNNILDFDIVRFLSYHPNIIGIIDSSSDFIYKTKISFLCNENFIFYCSNDLLLIPSLSLNIGGFISLISNAFPKEINEIYNSYLNETEMIKSYMKLYKLIEDVCAEQNNIGIKYLLFVMGFKTNIIRLPYARASINLRRKIEEDYLEFVEEK